MTPRSFISLGFISTIETHVLKHWQVVCHRLHCPYPSLPALFCPVWLFGDCLHQAFAVWTARTSHVLTTAHFIGGNVSKLSGWLWMTATDRIVVSCVPNKEGYCSHLSPSRQNMTINRAACLLHRTVVYLTLTAKQACGRAANRR